MIFILKALLKYFIVFFAVMFSSSLLFSSCGIEKKIANDFVKNLPEINLQVFTPAYVYKYNHKGEQVPGLASMSDREQDSALMAGSKFIQYIDDSLFLDHYVNNFIDELRALNFKVYLDSSLDSLLSGKPQSYVVNLAQVQLDEYTYPLEDAEPVDDTVYRMKFDLNAVDGESWFELSKLNSQKPVKTVLYSAFTANDAFQGNFFIDPFSNRGVRYKYKIDSLKVRDIYNMAEFMGKKNASYLFDYFMNQYVAYHMPEGVEVRTIYHYNRFRRLLEKVDDDRFEVQESK